MRARCGFAIVTVTAKALDGEPPTVHQRPASSGGTAMCCAGCAPRVKVKVDAFFGGVFVVVTSHLFRLSRRCHGRVGSIHHQKGELSLFFWFAFGCFARAFSVCHPFVSRFLAWARSGVRRSVPPTSHERIKIPIWWWHRNV